MPPPIALSDVPDDLTCSICMTLPLEPVITPCEHVFCRDCIRQALATANLCPIDREHVHIRQIRDLQGCLYRIWSNIQVKCGNHNDGCAWTGSLSDYSRHTVECSGGRSSQTEALREENEQLKLQLQNKQRKITQLKEQLRNRPNLPRIFEGEYDFKRENVVKLSQLVSRYLEDKPAEIDSNRIFNCVRACYTDLSKNYSDNPQHFRMDMKMLLATCQASTWFTDRQLKNIAEWYDEQF